MSEVKIMRNFISEEEQCVLAAHAHDLMSNHILEANGYGPHRFFKSIRGTPYNLELIETIGARVAALLASGDPQVDESLGWIISYIAPGGFIQPHLDNTPPYVGTGRKHVRCNVVVSKDAESGNPIINGLVYPVEARDMWLFYASEHPHSSQVVAGPSPRIIYQFGFSVTGVPFLDRSPTLAGGLENLLRQALVKQPDNPKVLTKLRDYYRSQGRLEAAAEIERQLKGVGSRR